MCKNHRMSLISPTHGTHVPTITIHRGMRLAAARQDAKITQERMAQFLGCTRRTIVRWESDDTSAPPAVIIAYSVATNTNLGWLQSGIADSVTPEFAEFVNDESPRPMDEGTAVRPKGLEPLTFWLVADQAERAADDAAFWSIVCQEFPDTELTNVTGVV